MNRRHFLRQAGVALLAGSMGFSRRATARSTSSGMDVVHLKVSGSPLRLLQFTDVHFFIRFQGDMAQAMDSNVPTVDLLKQLVDRADPHLIMVTGDFWHDNPDGKGLEFLAYGLDVMAGLERPWLFTWGNHDQVDDLNRAHRMLSEAPHSLYAGATSAGNYLVRIGPENQSMLDLFCLNSGKEGLKQPARDWMDHVVQRLSAENVAETTRVAVFHIPLRQYREAWEHPEAKGFKGENVSYYQEDGQNLACFARHGIRATICGHNHTNDYEGITGNTRLVYGRATGLNGYGGEVLPKGAKLYTYTPETRDFSWQTLLPDGSTWQPAPGDKTTKSEG
ncbi:MAG: metallophosphoesterase [Candidatus Hydrogenedentes bacterium]|nr:metallophosphoesterase [Candidatus Hydrogenedentota bacterium]